MPSNILVWEIGGPVVIITILFIYGFVTISALNRDRDKKLDHSLMLVGLQVKLKPFMSHYVAWTLLGQSFLDRSLFLLLFCVARH